VLVIVVVLLAPSARAHPLGNFTVNLYSGITLSQGVVAIDYVLEMAEISTQEQKPGMDLDANGEISAEERQGWADRAAAQLLTNLHLVVNGQEVELRVVDDSLTFRSGQAGLDTLYMQARYEGVLTESGGAEYRDVNYQGRPGWREITLTADDSVAILASDVPETSISEELRDYPAGRDEDVLDVTSATFSYQASDAPVEGTATEPSPTVGPSTDDPPSPIASGLPGLLATAANRALLPMLALAFGFGFLHALGPGHGKVVIASSGLATSIRIRHAVAVGVVVAMLHSASIVALGLVAWGASRTISSETVYEALQFVSALAVLSIGVYLLVHRWRERSRGEQHLDHEERGLDRASFGAIAASGGLIPSPAGVVVVLGALAAGRVPLGLALVTVFSLGLASALILVGIASIYVRGFAERTRLAASSWLPLAAAALIVIVGLVLTINVFVTNV
jgi:ABC-type nickel/cobalt efflux system permease component RcnA